MNNNINTQINLEQILFYVTSSKKQIVCYDIHPILPYMVIGYDNGKIVIWDYKNRRKIREFSLEIVIQGILETRTLEDKQMKLGRINCLRFYDKDVIESGGAKKDIMNKSRTRCEFLVDLYIIVITENRVLFFDYVGSNTKEIKMVDLGGKEQKTCELFWEGEYDKMIAFGGAEGTLRLWDFTKWAVAKTLTGTKGAITKIITFPLTNNGVGIASIDGSGLLNMWDLNNSEKMSISERAHKGEIENITFDPLSHTLVTSGIDKNIICWDLVGSKIKTATYKENLSFVSSFSNARAQTTSIIFTKKDKLAVYHSMIDSSAKTVTMFNIPNESKKNKITNITLHPINHNIIFVEINKESLYVYSYDPYYPPNIAIAKKLIYWEEQSHIKFNTFEEKTQSLFFSSSTLCKVGPWNPSERVTLSISPSGTLLAAFSNSQSRVSVFDLTNKGKLVFDGGVKSFCWSKTHEKFAILLQLEKGVEVKVSSFRSKKTVQVISGHELQIFQANRETGDCKMLPSVKAIETKREVNYLIDGFLLGVVLCATEKSAASLQFFSWNGNPIGHVFPEPSFVVWHPDHLYCLLAFPTKLAIFKTSPTFKLIMSIDFVITSAFWFRDSLIYTNDNEIGFLFPNAKNLDPIPICSYLPLVDSPFVSSTPRRPIGALRIIDILDKEIIVLDLNYEIHKISIDCEGIKTLILISGGELELAIKWAEAIPPQHHLALSRLFSSFGYPAQSLQLSGLSLHEKLTICVKHGLVAEVSSVLEEIIEKEISQNINNKDNFYRSEIIKKVPKLVDNFLKDMQEDFDERTTESFISLYSQISRVDRLSKLKLIVFLVKGEKRAQLEELHSNLMEEGDFDSASFAASFINDDQLFASLQQGKLYPKLTALVRSSANLNQQLINELLEGWNSYLSTFEKSITILKT